MPSVKVRDNESLESAMKQFKKQCEREGILSEIKKREHYDKPSVKKKKKIIAARKKASKRVKFF
ncbi:MAG: 30S ribosomal protein S21 [Thermodesulfovibrio sp.]|nr:30S ribosomal protein S21 [Thermodesulfovibrio sp.]